MKLIDEKGRLFKKINIIDLLVILLLLGLTPFLYYGYKIANYKPPKVAKAPPPPPFLQGETVREFEVMFSSVPEKFLSLISVGDKQYKNIPKKQNETKKKQIPIAEIVKIIKKSPQRVVLGGSNKLGPKYEFDLEKFYNLKVLMKLLITPVKGYFVYQGTQLTVNSEFKFSTDKYTINAYLAPTPPPPAKNPTKKIYVTVQVNNLMPEIASIITKGDKEIELENKLTIAEIAGILKIEKARIIRFYEGVTRQFENPFYRDVTLDIRLLATQIKGKSFFKNTPVKIGNVVSFSTKRYSLSGTIVNILKE